MTSKRVLVIGSLIVLVFLLALFLPAQQRSEANWYNAGLEGPLTCDSGSCTGTNPYAPGETSDLIQAFILPHPARNFYYAGVITFQPPDVDQPTSLPLGAMMGELQSTTYLGTFNTACKGSFAPLFEMQNGVNSPGDYHADWSEDGAGANTCSDGAENGTDDVADKYDPDCWDYLYVMAEDQSNVPDTDCRTGDADMIALANHVKCYPTMAFKLFDPDYVSEGVDGIPGTADDVDGPRPPLVPRARLSGHTVISGADVVIQFYVFNPGQLADAFDPPHPYSQLTADFGWPSAVVLQDPTIPNAPTALTTFCTPLASVTTLWGKTQDNPVTTIADEGGYVARQNPPDNSGLANAAGDGTNTHILAQLSISNRDYDGDGVENDIETCPFLRNEEDYRLTSGQDVAVGDMIDPACDPDPTVNENNGDYDLDGYKNANDTCNQIADAGQKDSELYLPWPADAGPRTDGIPDACDPDDANPNGGYHARLAIAPICIGDPDPTGDGADRDTDNDGWCDATEDAYGSDDTAAPAGDQDGDTIPNGLVDGLGDPLPYCQTGESVDCNDNCPADWNPGQENTASGNPGSEDECVDQPGHTPNAPPGECEPDPFGDVCDLNYPHQKVNDYDGDTHLDDVDPCPQHFNMQAIALQDDDNDGIGDMCDPLPNIDFSPYGRPEHKAPVYPLPLNNAGADPIDPADPDDGVAQMCNDGIDNDGDTTCDDDGCLAPDGVTSLPADLGCQADVDDSDGDGVDDSDDNCIVTPNRTQTDTDGDGIGDACDHNDDGGTTYDREEWLDGTDPLDDGSDDQALDTADPDADMAPNWQERYQGTDPNDPCGDDCGGAKTHDAWPFDIDLNCWCSSTDILAFPANISMAAKNGTEPTYDERYDFDGNEWVSSTDILAFPANINMADDGENPPGVDDPNQP